MQAQEIFILVIVYVHILRMKYASIFVSQNESPFQYFYGNLNIKYMHIHIPLDLFKWAVVHERSVLVVAIGTIE